jgi:hypothetical protein
MGFYAIPVFFKSNNIVIIINNIGVSSKRNCRRFESAWERRQFLGARQPLAAQTPIFPLNLKVFRRATDLLYEGLP